MTNEIDMLVLANSRKNGGRCIAGIDLDTREWIRPVTTVYGAAIPISWQKLQDGNDLPILSSVRVKLGNRHPLDGYQSENFLLEWLDVKSAANAPDEIQEILTDVAQEPLWRSTYMNSIPYEDAKLLDSSLRLILVEDLSLAQVKNPRTGRLVDTALFTDCGIEYALPMTDPVWAKSIDGTQSRRINVGEAYLTISLGEKYNDNVYKLVAAIVNL